MEWERSRARFEDVARDDLRHRLWVRMWKRDLQLLVSKELPRYEVSIEAERATFAWDDAVTGGRAVIVAENLGERLGWRETGALEQKEDPRTIDEARWSAAGTFALHLAMQGWPLLRSDEEWAKQLEQGFSDAGESEGLAFKIQRWSAYAAHRGWRCTSPRIPGLPMPTWAELEAQWERERKEMEDDVLAEDARDEST